jgi:hypothetical protein
MQPPPPEAPPAAPPTLAATPSSAIIRRLRWVFIGSQGLRAGWSVLLFVMLTLLFVFALGSAATIIFKNRPHTNADSFTPFRVIVGGVIEVLALLGAYMLMALIERRRILDYNMGGPRRVIHFLSGLAAGFVSLSALVGALAWGGWLHFGPAALSGAQIYGFAALWAVGFLCTGFFEEGSFRCYLLFTITRGINFWWALGIAGAVCLWLLLTAKGNGVWGVYIVILLGLAPCLLLHLKKSKGSGFWQAAWVTSTLFGFLHTFNGGENLVGIFAAAAMGFVFCVSVRVTGSAWWAIGCHAAWDWGESYFYGTADSGMVVKGHYLTTSPAGNALWSGGADGPEGSLLVLGVILLLLAALIILYGRGRLAPATASLEQAAV